VQDALWKHAIDWPNDDQANAERHAPVQLKSFLVEACVVGMQENRDAERNGEDKASLISPAEGRKRQYNKSPRKPRIRSYSLRIDPFEGVTDQLYAWLLERPERSAKDLLLTLQDKHPD
jgi:hypothetical protein